MNKKLTITILPIIIYLSWFSLCFGVNNPKLNDKEVARLIFENVSDEPSQEIKNFIRQKVKQIAATNKQFADDILLDQIDSADEFQFQPIDNNHILIIVPTYLHAYQASGCLFVVHKTTGDWQPVMVQTVVADEQKTTGSYSFITDGISYSSPILHVWARGAGWYGGIGTEYKYLFQNGSFNLIRMVNHEMTEEGMKRLDKNPEASPDDFIIPEIKPVDKAIIKLYEMNAPKGAPSLSKIEGWKRIFFVSKDKSYFFEQPDEKTQKKSYLVNGDAVYVDKIQGTWANVKYNNATTHQKTDGWMKLECLMNLDVEDGDLHTLKL